MAYTAISAYTAGVTLNGAGLNVYLRDNINALNGNGVMPPLAAVYYRATLPSNWFNCDGTIGAPDLRDRWLAGAGSLYSPGDVGGAASDTRAAHTAHVINQPAHSQHGMSASTHSSSVNFAATGGGSPVISDGSHSGGLTTGGHAVHDASLSDTHAHVATATLPPYKPQTLILKGTPTITMTTPRTWADGDVPTAAMFNADIRDNMAGLYQRCLLPGMIIVYPSATAPAGWQLCDGSNGAPDYRDYFVMGAGSTYVVDTSGGALTAAIPNHADHVPTQATAHGSHGVSLPDHAFKFSTPLGQTSSFLPIPQHIGISISAGHGAAHTGFLVGAHGGHVPFSTLPPYIALSYIQLLSAGSFTTPRTWTDGELVDQGRLNTYLRDNFSVINAGQVPIGGIMPWTSTFGSIPANYQVANGTGGTYNAIDRFIVGAGVSYAVGATGGATTGSPNEHGLTPAIQPATHANHSVTNADHGNVGYTAFSNANEVRGGSHDYVTDGSVHSHSWDIDSFGNHSLHGNVPTLPPYYALYFIQRMS